MINALNLFLATNPIVRVPESGTTIALVTGGVVALGLCARFVKNRKK